MMQPKTWEEAALLVAKESVELISRKNRDYGTKNIIMTGQTGIAIRLLDKAARLFNLSRAKAAVKSEAYTDTLRDVVGYGIIGQMLERGWFELPHELAPSLSSGARPCLPECGAFETHDATCPNAGAPF